MKFILNIIFLYFKVAGAELTVCRWNNLYGICIPEEDCHGESVNRWWDCGRNKCCIDPTLVRKKCTEYINEVNEDDEQYQTTRTNNRIIGGDLVKLNEMPYMAGIGFEVLKHNNISWECGGSVISHNFILSAAHCFTKRVYKTWTLVGAVSLDDPEGQLRPVKEILKHPKYLSWKHQYDVALLKLETSLEFTSRLHPSCFLYEHEMKHLKTSLAAGWGKIHEDDLTGVRELRKVELDIVYLEECRKYHPFLAMYDGFLPSMICAGHLTGCKDTCQGDSGGPLTIPMAGKNNFHGIVGITSTSCGGCGKAMSPAIYSRLSYFLSWIVKIVWPKEIET